MSIIKRHYGKEPYNRILKDNLQGQSTKSRSADKEETNPYCGSDPTPNKRYSGRKNELAKNPNELK